MFEFFNYTTLMLHLALTSLFGPFTCTSFSVNLATHFGLPRDYEIHNLKGDGITSKTCCKMSRTQRLHVKSQVPSGAQYPDSTVHGANMWPTWVLSVPDGPNVGPRNLAIRVSIDMSESVIVTVVTRNHSSDKDSWPYSYSIHCQ